NLTTYADRTAFTAASHGLHTIDFTGLTAGTPEGYYGLGPSGTFDGITFSTMAADGGSLAIMDPSHYDPEYGSHSGEYLLNNGGSTGIYIALPPGTTAFGADFFAWAMVGVGGACHRATSTFGTFTVTGEGTYQLTVQTSPNSTFWGFTSDTPVT